MAIAKGTIKTIMRMENLNTGDEKHIFLEGLWNYFDNKYEYFIKVWNITGKVRTESPRYKISEEMAATFLGNWRNRNDEKDRQKMD